MKKTQIQKHFLGLAGEYLVCAELAKKEINASLTFGNHKSIDIIASNPTNNKSCFIQVKTSNSSRILTGFFQKYKTGETAHPDFWIIVNFNNNNTNFYILTHVELANIQMQINKMSEWSEIKGGVDNINLKSIEIYKNQWDKIINFLI